MVRFSVADTSCVRHERHLIRSCAANGAPDEARSYCVFDILDYLFFLIAELHLVVSEFKRTCTQPHHRRYTCTQLSFFKCIILFMCTSAENPVLLIVFCYIGAFQRNFYKVQLLYSRTVLFPTEHKEIHMRAA